MKIVLTNNEQTIAGGENYVLFLAEGLSKIGHETIIAPRQGSELEKKSKELGYQTIPMNYESKGKELFSALRFRELLKKENVDLIHTNSNFDRTIGAITARLLRCKSIASVHSCLSIQHNITHLVRNKFLIDYFITDSFASRDILVNDDKIPQSKVEVIHIGIPATSIKVSDELRVNTRKSFGIQDEEILLGCVSRLVEFKGHTFLIQALAEALKELPKLKLIIIGDGELMNDLVNEAKVLGVSDNVHFVGYRSDLENFMSAFDIFVHPSIDFGGESFPIAVLSALSAGLPIIASDVADVKYQVFDGFNGFITEPKNVIELKNKILELSINFNQRIKFGKNSLTHFQNNFTIEIMVDKVNQLYHKVLKNKNS
ncbi:MAG: glycosyltransferase family 4 protein [Ignavibacteria bacterium]|nr:glycosyltransferase family 4 protein [Ignavibacteria bacterium]